MDEKSRKDELDDFWSLDDLVPKSKSYAPVKPERTETVEITVDAPKEEHAPVTHFIPPHTEKEYTERPKPEETYQPDSPLIMEVRIYPWKSPYRYYEDFANDAFRLYPIRGDEAERASFFSYVPQYTQMNRAQLEWYLFWRENFRKGIYLDTDYSYLLLYAYELINLSDKIPGEQVRDGLAELWANYRDVFHQMDSILPEWICDICLLKRLPPPEICRGKLLRDVVAHCNFREFFAVSAGDGGYVRALLTFCSNYDYRKSKFYDANKALFDRVIPFAMETVLQGTSQDGKLFSTVQMDSSRIFRDAFAGALCSYRIKRKIEAEYSSFSRSHEMRFVVTDVVKYAENKIRTAIGVKSKLTVYSLPDKVRAILDGALADFLPQKNTAKPQNAPAEYEKLYDLPKREFSLEAAKKIESESWQTTEQLISAFDTEDIPNPMPVKIEAAIKESAEKTDWMESLKPYLAFLKALGDSAKVKEAVKAVGMLPDAIADLVNEAVCEQNGDILLEDNGDGYQVIADYREFYDSLIAEMEKRDGTK